MRYTAKIVGTETIKNAFSDKLIPHKSISKILSMVVHRKDRKDENKNK